MFSQIHQITSKQKKVALQIFLLGALTLTSACGKNGGSPIATLVNDVKIKTYDRNNEQWLDTTIMLSTGGFSLAGINVPITNPLNPSVLYGELNLVSNFCTTSPCNGGGELTVSVNLTQASQSQGVETTLPNGTHIPVGGLQNATIVALPIAQTGAKIYIAFGPGVAMFGAAVPFNALDPAGKYLPGVNIFEPLTFNKVSLIAGLFAGANTNTTGVGLFIDLSALLNENNPLMLGARTHHEMSSAVDGGTPITSDGMLLPWKNGVHNAMILAPVKPSAATERKMYMKLYNLSQQGLTLKIQQ